MIRMIKKTMRNNQSKQFLGEALFTYLDNTLLKLSGVVHIGRQRPFIILLILY